MYIGRVPTLVGQQRAPTAGPSRRFSASSGARGPATGHSWLATVSALRRPYFVAQQPPGPADPPCGLPQTRLDGAAAVGGSRSVLQHRGQASSVQRQGPLNLLSRRPGASLARKPRFGRCLCHMPALACAYTPAPIAALQAYSMAPVGFRRCRLMDRQTDRQTDSQPANQPASQPDRLTARLHLPRSGRPMDCCFSRRLVMNLIALLTGHSEHGQ